MHKILSAIPILILTASIAMAQSDEAAIRAVIQKELDTWNSGDIEGYVNLYAPVDSVRMIYNGGEVIGKENILQFYKKHWPKDRMGRLEFTDVRLERVSPEYFYTQGHFHVTQADGKKVKGRFSGLMKKIDGKWYLYTDHSG
jgi:uncharacterized protein (TIGR02246 family)